MKKLVLGFAAVVALTFTSCSSDDSTPASSNLDLRITGLQDLGSNFQYEGWIIVNGSPVSTGTFSVDASGTLSQTSFPVNTSQLAGATRFVLSIEPIPDTDPNPAATKLLAGDFVNNSATINSDNIVVDPMSTVIRTLGASSGKYFLGTPTDGNTNMNEESGVWFIDNSSGSMMAGLSLPTLSAGWQYEGWVDFGNGNVLSTGTFTSATGADTSPGFSGPQAAPGFPGEDFLTNAPAGLTFPTDLKGKTVVISVEPVPDNSPEPFTLKPLAHPVPNTAMPYVVETLGAGPVAIISGTVVR